MRQALGLPIPEATLETWAGQFCFPLEPLCLDESLAKQLEGQVVVLTRAEWNFWMRAQPLEYADAYRPWSVRAEFVALMSAAEFIGLEPELQREINRCTAPSGRGLVFTVAKARAAGISEVFLERDSVDDQFVLHSDAWNSLNRTQKFAWLERYVSQDAPSCLSSSLPDHPALEWIGWLPHSGPNCFSTALMPLPRFGVGAQGLAPLRQTIASLWLHAAPFVRLLETWGHTEQPFSADLEPGWVLAWRDSSEALVHACAYLGDGLVLNKDSQAWYSPRQILGLETVIDRWSDVAPRPSLFRPV